MSSTEPLIVNQQSITPELLALLAAIKEPRLFGDERDKIIAKFNQLQAGLGVGKGHYERDKAVDFSNTNFYATLKGVIYKPKSSHTEHEGLVVLVLSTPFGQVDSPTGRQLVSETVMKCFSGQPILKVCIDAVNPLNERQTSVSIYGMRAGVSGGESSARIYSSDLEKALKQPTIAQQLKASLNAVDVFADVKLNPDLERRYLENPPAGINTLVWQQGVNANPDPSKYLPVPIVGTQALFDVVKQQHSVVQMYSTKLEQLSAAVASSRVEQDAIQSRQAQLKRKHALLSHRLLVVMAKQELYRRQGCQSDSPEQIVLQRVTQLNSVLNGNGGVEAQITELQSSIGHKSASEGAASVDTIAEGTELDPQVQKFADQTSTHLALQQNAIGDLFALLQQDLNDISVMANSFEGHKQQPTFSHVPEHTDASMI